MNLREKYENQTHGEDMPEIEEKVVCNNCLDSVVERYAGDDFNFGYYQCDSCGDEWDDYNE